MNNLYICWNKIIEIVSVIQTVSCTDDMMSFNVFLLQNNIDKFSPNYWNP